MKSQVYTNIGIALLFLLSVIGIVLYSQELHLFSLSLIFLTFAFILLRNSYERRFFILSYSISLVCSMFLVDSYFSTSGQPFIPGGDAQRYYENVIAILKGDDSSYYGRFKLYYTVNVFYYQIISTVFNSTSYWYFFVANIFACSFISPLLFKIGNLFFNKKVVLKSCYLALSYPLIIQVATNSWREATVYAPFLLIVYISLTKKTFKSVFLFFLTIYYIANIRLEIGVIAILFFFVYNYIFTGEEKAHKYFNFTKIFMGLIIFGGLVGAFFLGYFEYFKFNNSVSVAYQVDAYNDLSTNSTDGSSVATFLRSLGPPGYLLLFFYALFVPIPPPFVGGYGFTFFTLFTGVGSIIWYFILPSISFSIYKSLKLKELKNFTRSFTLITIIGIFIIAITSLGSPRHKLYLYPILFLYFFWGQEELKKSTKKNLMRIVIVIYLLSFLGYLFFKSS